MAKKEELGKRYKDLANKLKNRAKDIAKRGYSFKEPEKPKRITETTIKKLEDMIKNIYKYARYYDPLKDKYIKGTVRRKQEYSIASRKGWETRRAREKVQQYESDKEKADEIFKDLVEKRRKAFEQQPQTGTRGIEEYPNEALEILRKVVKMIDDWQPLPEWSGWLAALKREDRNALKAIVDGAITEFGWKQCAKNIKNEATWFFNLCEHILYESESRKGGSSRDEIRRDLVEVATIIRGRPLTVEESIDITDLEEELNEL